jgi:8-oxo-dGTP diphosphatase
MGLSEVVRAAGGVVYRTNERGEIEVLLVHRPEQADWTFPKGKVLSGETEEACALREVEEETGLRCVLEAELPGASYQDHKGRPKLVRYWAMHSVAGIAHPRNEVDVVRWASLASAVAILTYERDRELLAVFARRPA